MFLSTGNVDNLRTTLTYPCFFCIHSYIQYRYDYSDSSSEGEDFGDADSSTDNTRGAASASTAASKKKRAITADGVSGSSSSAKGVAARQQKAANSAKAARYYTYTLLHFLHQENADICALYTIVLKYCACNSCCTLYFKVACCAVRWIDTVYAVVQLCVQWYS
jgi:hypothetical protein